MVLYDLVATCPLYTEDLLKEELLDCGGREPALHHGAVTVKGTLETAYRACLWSRIANKVLFPLLDFRAGSKAIT